MTHSDSQNRQILTEDEVFQYVLGDLSSEMKEDIERRASGDAEIRAQIATVTKLLTFSEDIDDLETEEDLRSPEEREQDTADEIVLFGMSFEDLVENDPHWQKIRSTVKFDITDICYYVGRNGNWCADMIEPAIQNIEWLQQFVQQLEENRDALNRKFGFDY